MAASLPGGIAAPTETASWFTDTRDARWVLVKNGRAYYYTASARAFFDAVASKLGMSLPLRAVTSEFLTAFRNAMIAAAQDTSRFSITEMTRETLRAMCWWISENQGERDGDFASRIWLPNGRIAAPPMGEAIPSGPSGVYSVELRAGGSSSGGTPLILGGGSGSSGGGSGSSSGGSSGGSSRSNGSSSSGASSTVAQAAMTGGKVLLGAALVLGVGVAAMGAKRGEPVLQALPLPMPWRKRDEGDGAEGERDTRVEPKPRAARGGSVASRVGDALKGGA